MRPAPLAGCSAAARAGAAAAPLQCQAKGNKSKRAAGQQQRDTRAEEAATILRRLRRQPLVLTTHAQERLRNRRVSLEDVQHVLQHGLLNWKLSKFGGKPSPVYVLEGPGASAGPSTEQGTVPASGSAGAAGGQGMSPRTRGDAPEGPAAIPASCLAAAENEAGFATTASTATAAEAGMAAAPAAAAQPPRSLRVPFAANGSSTVALTVVDLQLDGDEG